MRIILNAPTLSISILALSIYSHLCYSEELNFSFLQGTNTVPSVLLTNSQYPAGEYFVDVFLNNEKTGKTILNISSADEKKNSLCLSSKLLSDNGIFFTPSNYDKHFDSNAQCYRLGDEPHSRVNFEYGSQSLKISVPQAYLLNKKDVSLWDYGANGTRLKYYGNFNKNSSEDVSTFGNANLSINFERWVLSSNMNASKNSGENKFSTNDLTLSRAIGEVQGDLMLGKSQTRTNLFSDFGFYGVALRSNSNMGSGTSRGYAPLISGVANSQSRITITQGGYTIYSKVVPAGPYQFDDVSPVTNGDLILTVEDDSGRKTVTTYPVATLPTLIRPGEFEYNLAVGKKNNSTELKNAFSSGNGTFWLGSLNYGFAFTTLNTAAIIHNKYQGGGVGITQSMGNIGAVEGSISMANAHYNTNKSKSGSSVALKYAKSFTETTDLQLLTYRYQSKGYVDFSNFNANEINSNRNEKSRYEARISHRFTKSYLSASYWQQDYWQRSGHEKGAMFSASTSFEDISLFLNGSYSKRSYSDVDDYSVSLSVSVPFNIHGTRHYSNSSVGYSDGGGTIFNTGVSATVDERLNYSLSADADSRGNRGATGSASYAFDSVQTNLSLSKNKYRTSFSGGFSGSAIATSQTGLLLTKGTSDTIGIVNIEGMEGVTFNGSLPTNSNGDTVVYLSEYYPNTISVNMDNIPDNAELTTTSYNVVPTEKSIIYRKFGFENVKRYILRVKNPRGEILNGGNAKTKDGLNAGFISNNGVLLMNMLAAPDYISVDTGDGMSCGFTMSGVKFNTNKVQEVLCE